MGMVPLFSEGVDTNPIRILPDTMRLDPRPPSLREIKRPLQKGALLLDAYFDFKRDMTH